MSSAKSILPKNILKFLNNSRKIVNFMIEKSVECKANDQKIPIIAIIHREVIKVIAII